MVKGMYKNNVMDKKFRYLSIENGKNCNGVDLSTCASILILHTVGHS